MIQPEHPLYAGACLWADPVLFQLGKFDNMLHHRLIIDCKDPRHHRMAHLAGQYDAIRRVLFDIVETTNDSTWFRPMSQTTGFFEEIPHRNN